MRSLATVSLDSGKPDSVHVAQRDLTHEAVKIFGDSVATAPPAAAEPTWDIDVRSFETHDRVVYFVGRFTGPSSDRFEQELARGGRYEPIIRRKLHAAGMPEDMTYLALIESGYNPHAYSSAAAVGLWQFMASTARGTGLRVDWWIDERRDPVRSTDGAIKFLGWLKDQFGSYYLAAAAYNGGAGRVSRGLKRYADEVEGESGDSAFFSMAAAGNYLRAETRDYVPKLIAAALVAKEPAKYGLKVSYLPEFSYDTRAGRTGNAARGGREGGRRIARGHPGSESRGAARHHAAGSAIRDSRAEGTRGWIRQRVRAARIDPIASAFTQIVREEGRDDGVARAARRRVRALAHLVQSLPQADEARAASAGTAGAPSVIRGGRRGARHSRIRRWRSGARPARLDRDARRGEGRDARAHRVRYGTTVTGLMRLNGMSGSRLIPGQVLIVKTGSRSRTARVKSKAGELRSLQCSDDKGLAGNAPASPLCFCGRTTQSTVPLPL